MPDPISSLPFPSLIRLDTILPQPLTWLWRSRLPMGCLSLLVGHPDRGKSLFACTCAAHVTTGNPWPDETPCLQGSVIFLEAEDSLEGTTLPRLQIAQADLTKIVTWRERDLRQLTMRIEEVHPRFVVISPLNTYLPKINTWHDQEVRRALQPLADLAAQTQTAILGIMHPPKSKQAIPIHAIVGSIAFGAVARSVLSVERGENGLYLLEGVKQNLAMPMTPLGYHIIPSPLNPEVAQLQWEEVPATLSFSPADEERTALAQACDLLTMALEDEPVTSVALHEACLKNGISWRTMATARKLLRIHATRVCKGGKSHWELWMPKNAKE